MLPPALEFDLRPRRPRLWLRVLTASVALGPAAGSALWLASRHAELERLQAGLAQAQMAAASAASAPERPAPWMISASQDDALFALAVEPRLLEIERCTDAKAVVSRIVHDAAEQGTSLELNVVEPDAVRGLLECLNQSSEKHLVWRLLSVESQSVDSISMSDKARSSILVCVYRAVAVAVAVVVVVVVVVASASA